MFIINSYIYDIDTKEALPFASAVLTDSKGNQLKINGNFIGNKSNEDGKLILPVAEESAYVKVSYVGYEPIIHPADDYRNDDIYLAKKSSSATASDTVIKAKRIYPKKSNSKKTPWLLYAIVAGAIVAAGIVIYKLVKK